MSSYTSKRRQETKALRERVKSDLTEFLGEQGFERDGGDSLTYRYRCRRPDQHDLLEVQFSKYQSPKFKVNLGTVPTTGFVDAWGRLLPPQSARIGQLAQRGELCAVSIGKFLFGWFGIGRLSMLPADTAAASQIAKVKQLFNQADRWFRTGVTGPNISVYYLEALGPNASRRHMEKAGTWPPANWTEEDEEAVRRAEELIRMGPTGAQDKGKEQ